jgi:hypothetical protein
MLSISQSLISLILLSLAVVIALILSIAFMVRRGRGLHKSSDKFEDLYLRISEEIRYSIVPKSIQLSIGVNDLVELAVEVWRMEQRITKSAAELPENQLKGLENSIQKFRRYLEKYDIEIVDYRNTKYNPGLSLDILSVEKDLSLPEPIVKETVEPTIMCKGQVVRKAKIILLTNK